MSQSVAIRKTKREVIAEFRTEEILQAARVVFAKNGFYETTVDEIARAAGISKGTLYLYYKSKMDIYWAALKFGVAEMHEMVHEELKNVPSVKEKIRTFIRVKMDYFQKNRDFFKIYYSEFGNAFCHPIHMQKEFRDLYRRQIDFLESILREGVKTRSIRELPVEATAWAIADLTRSVITQHLMNWSKRTIEEDSKLTFDLIWKGISK
jgi:AcrR family transcriptional regulator